jgi:hypothetical protein
MQGLAKSIAWDGEGATCLIEVKWHNPLMLFILDMIIGLLGFNIQFSLSGKLKLGLSEKLKL